MSSGAQDFHITIPAGGTRNISRQGEFVYLKAADRAVDVIMPNQTRVTMEAGDKLRQDIFSGFQIQNPDPLNPAALVFTVGMGDYWRQIVQGEISVVPGLRGADGQWRPDTRQSISLDILPRISESQHFAAGATMQQSAMATNQYLNQGPEGTVIDCTVAAGKVTGIRVIDKKTLQQSGSAPAYAFADGSYGNDLIYSPVHGYLFVYHNGLYKASDASAPLVALAGTDYGTACRLYDRANFKKAGYLVICYGGPGGSNVILNESDLSVALTDIPNLGVISNQSRVRFDPYQNVVIYAQGGAQQSLYSAGASDLSFDPVTKTGLDQYSDNAGEVGFVPQGRFAFVGYSSGHAGKGNISRAVAETFDTPLEVQAIKDSGGGCVAAQVLGRDRTAHLYTTAGVTVTGSGDDLSVWGELVKFALENYFRAEVEPNYLDHVFSVEFSRPGNGALSLPVNGGVNSFDRQSIADDFTVYLPTNIKLTIDQGLSLGDGSQVQG